MKQAIALIVMAAMLGTAAPAAAAGCLKGAAAGALAGHLAHHAVLGALGGCFVGHEVAKHAGTRTSVTYADIGTMLGDGSTGADWSKVSAAPKVDVIRVSSLKGYVPNDAKLQAAITANPDVKVLDTEIAGDANLTARLKSAKSTPDDVIAAATDTSGGTTLFINK